VALRSEGLIAALLVAGGWTPGLQVCDLARRMLDPFLVCGLLQLSANYQLQQGSCGSPHLVVICGPPNNGVFARPQTVLWPQPLRGQRRHPDVAGVIGKPHTSGRRSGRDDRTAGRTPATNLTVGRDHAT